MANTYRSVSTHTVVKIIGFHTSNNFSKNSNFLTSTAIQIPIIAAAIAGKMPNT